MNTSGVKHYIVNSHKLTMNENILNERDKYTYNAWFFFCD